MTKPMRVYLLFSLASGVITVRAMSMNKNTPPQTFPGKTDGRNESLHFTLIFSPYLIFVWTYTVVPSLTTDIGI